jgi:hypothetical protein
MEAQKEKRIQSSSLLKDKTSLSDQQLNAASAASEAVERLAVISPQLNSISPTLHKVQVRPVFNFDSRSEM